MFITIEFLIWKCWRCDERHLLYRLTAFRKVPAICIHAKKQSSINSISSFDRIEFRPSKKKKHPNDSASWYQASDFHSDWNDFDENIFLQTINIQRNRLDYNNNIQAYNFLLIDHLPNGSRRKRKIKKRKLRYSVIISSNQNGPQRMIIINYFFRNANSFGIWFMWLAFEKSGGKVSFCFFFPCVKDYFHFLLKILLCFIHWNAFGNVISHTFLLGEGMSHSRTEIKSHVFSKWTRPQYTHTKKHNWKQKQRREG